MFPTRENDFGDPNKGQIVFTGDLTVRLAATPSNSLHAPGHTPVRIAVHCPRIGCCSPATPFFPECQTWLIASDVNQWITALDRIRTRRRPRGLRSWAAGD
jgi:cyclase